MKGTCASSAWSVRGTPWSRSCRSGPVAPGTVVTLARTRAMAARLDKRIAGEGEHEHAQPTPGVHVARRGTSRHAAHLVRGIIANHDQQARTAHHIAAGTDREQLPDGSPACSTAAPALLKPGGWPTDAGIAKSRTLSPNASAGSTNTSAAAKTIAWATASTSKPEWSAPHALVSKFFGGSSAPWEMRSRHLKEL